MIIKKASLICLCVGASLTSGCASTYGNLVSGSNLGAQEYMPAVLANTGMEGKYSEILGICRQVAVNRQVTAAQEAQLRTITGAVRGGVDGAAMGMQMGALFKSAGLTNGGVNRSTGIGAAAGLMTSLADSFASGANRNADETKRVLLECLKRADPAERFYKVIE